jgi:AcrR family transcriptional regulator
MSVTANRREVRKSTTRAALLAASERCFAQRGYRATAIADITREAGVAYGTFYVHFESKGALLDLSLARFNEALEIDLGRALSGPGDVERRIHDAAAIFLARCRERRWLVVALAERAGTGVTAEALRDGINPEVRGLLRALLAGAIAEDVDAELVVSSLLALWLRVALQVVLAARELDDDVAVETLARMTVGVLGAVARKEGRS